MNATLIAFKSEYTSTHEHTHASGGVCAWKDVWRMNTNYPDRVRQNPHTRGVRWRKSDYNGLLPVWVRGSVFECVACVCMRDANAWLSRCGNVFNGVRKTTRRQTVTNKCLNTFERAAAADWLTSIPLAHLHGHYLRQLNAIGYRNDVHPAAAAAARINVAPCRWRCG